jgi:glycosyltransferase involved in cell wall biosynthesis
MREHTQSPTLSIGFPVRNGMPFLETSVGAILDQDYSSFELIISDNASTDGTRDLCERLARKDPRIRYFRNDANIGVARNFNRTFELARGRFFKWASHDDISLPGLPRRCVDTLAAADPSVVLVYPRSAFINEAGERLPLNPGVLDLTSCRPEERLAVLLRNLTYTNALYGVFRSEVLQRTRLYLSFQGSDFVFFAEIAMLGRAVEIPEELFLRRLHPARVLNGSSTPDAIRHWIDPERVSWLDRLSLHDRLCLEHLRSVARLPLTPGVRMRCGRAVVAYYWGRRYRGVIGRRLRRLFGWLPGIRKPGQLRTGSPDVTPLP